MLDPANEDADAWYGTRPPVWSADPDDNMLGIRQVKVTGMMEHSAAATARVSIMNAEANNDTLLSTMVVGQQVVTSGIGTGLVPFSINLNIGRARDGVSGPQGFANNWSDTYNLYARVVDTAGNNVRGFSATSGQYAMNATPSTAIVIPKLNKLIAPVKDPANGLSLTVRGAFEIETGGTTPNSDVVRIYSDGALYNTLIHEEFVSMPTGFIGWNRLLVGYKKTVTLTRDANGKVQGNKASSGLASPWIFQYLLGLDLSSPDVKVP